MLKFFSRDYVDKDPISGKILPSFELISKSKAIRDQQTIENVHLQSPTSINSDRQHLVASSSEEDLAPTPPVEPINSDRPHLVQPRFLPNKPPQNQRCYKTALDVINETIVKTLDSPHHPGKVLFNKKA